MPDTTEASIYVSFGKRMYERYGEFTVLKVLRVSQITLKRLLNHVTFLTSRHKITWQIT
jgi:hypothetical protein